MDIQEFETRFNSLEINNDPHNLKSLTLTPPETSTSNTQPEKPTDELTPPAKLEKWEPSSSKPKFSIAPFITKLSYILLLIMLLPGTLAAPLINNYQNPMVCQTEQQGEYWTLPNFAPCPRLKANRTRTPVTQNIRLYRLNAFQQSNEAWACRIIKKGEQEYTNPTSDLIKRNIQPINLPVTPQNCKEMVSRKICKFGTLKEEAGLWHTDNRIFYEKRYPIFGWSWRSHYSFNCYIFKTQISVPHESELLQSPLGSMSHCSYRLGSCTLSDNTTLIWEPSPEKQCRFIRVGEYSGKFMDDIWLGDTIELGLSLNTKNPKIFDCNISLLLTEQGLAYEKIKSKPSPKRVKRFSSSEWNWNHESLLTDSQLEGQLTYLDHEMKESLTFQFTHSLHQLCEFAEETRKWTANALLSNPTTLARAILNNPNVIARHISGNTLKIWPCISLTPFQYRISPTNLDTCFDLLPVLIKTQGKDELAFLDPTTLIISPKARKAPCTQYRKIPVQINGTLKEIDQITGEQTILYTQVLTSKTFHEINAPKIVPHAFHHLVLVNLTDIISHSYLSSLTEISQITYRIENQNSAIRSTMSTEWEQNFTIIRAIGARIASKQNNPNPPPITKEKSKTEGDKKHQALFKNHPSQIVLELGRPLEGQPNKWPPSATKFPLYIPPSPGPKQQINNPPQKLNKPKRSHSSSVLIGCSYAHQLLPVINVTFDSMNVDCLIDTGSTLSLSTIGLAVSLGCQIEEGEIVVTTPSGHNVPITGKTTVEIIICTHSREIDLYLVPDDKFIGEGSFQAVLGCNLFALLPSISIDFVYSLFYVGEEGTSLIYPNILAPITFALHNNLYNSTITAYINNSQFRCLADTGATFTAAPLSLAEKLGSPIKYEKLGAISASGHHMPIIASSSTQICVAGYVIPLEIKFVDDKHFHSTKDYEIILGCDTFARLPLLTFNHNANTLTIGSNTTPMGIIQRTRSSIGIRAFNSITIPPESQCLVPIKVDNSDNPSTLSIDTLDGRLAKQDFSLIPTVIQPKNNLAVLPLINPTQEPKNIYRNMTIAYATEIVFDQDLSLFKESHFDSITSIEITDKKSLLEPDPTFTIDFTKSAAKGPDLEDLKSLCDEFSDIFSKSQYDLGSCKAGSHNIVTTTQEPITSKPHRTPFKYRDELKKHIDQLLNSGVMIQSDTPWVSNLVLVQKKDGGLRPCIDFRKLNEITVPDHFPLPRLETIMEKIGNCNFYSSLDLSSGYLQIPLTEEASRKCGLITEEGVFQMTHLPFGLRNATAAFSRTMSHVLSGVENVLTYVDDILVYTKSPKISEHLNSLRSVFERFRLFNLKLSPKKCKFATKSMDFLGYTVSGNGFIPSLSRIEVIKNLPTPTTLKQVRRIVGMASFYRKHILGFATIVEPLTSLNKKNKAFEWGQKQEQAFQKIKELLAKEPILTFPDYKLPFHIFTDASNVGHGAALMQKHDDKYCAIAYASRSLSPNERKWPPVQIELGAIIYALRIFRPYIYLSEVELHSDHRPPYLSPIQIPTTPPTGEMVN
uniref:RNA-directed DNA polymerase n=1 Tax=Meloidogyne enterolobii TaxID=390850 RepID=A0A6V7Y7F4_MELEN|nr:unnamed protein product [Meloidogyne enterolobii]